MTNHEIQELAAWLRAQCPTCATHGCETCGYVKAARIVEQYDPLTAENTRLRAALEGLCAVTVTLGGHKTEALAEARAALAGTP